jgi:hypothetical protein
MNRYVVVQFARTTAIPKRNMPTLIRGQPDMMFLTTQPPASTVPAPNIRPPAMSLTQSKGLGLNESRPARLAAAKPPIDTTMPTHRPKTFRPYLIRRNSLKADAPHKSPFCRKKPKNRPGGKAESTQLPVTRAASKKPELPITPVQKGHHLDRVSS